MKIKSFVICILFAALFLAESCVETVKENSIQTVNVFTDLPESRIKGVFANFEKKSKIHVSVYFASSDSIINNLKTEKWIAKADVVLLRNALDFIALTDQNILQKQHINSADTSFWQPLFHDPFVFTFPNDSFPCITSYGQLFRNKKARVDASKISSFYQWGNLIPSLLKKYPIYSIREIKSKILQSDTLKYPGTFKIQIAPYSSFLKKSTLTFPDQFYKGSIGTIGGMGIVRNSKNRSNGNLLYRYCKNNLWRKNLAKKIALFPIQDERANKSRKNVLYQIPPSKLDLEKSRK